LWGKSRIEAVTNTIYIYPFYINRTTTPAASKLDTVISFALCLYSLVK
jgi:hypothetical protein